MGHSQAEKAHSRERILQQAAQQIREHGLESISVGALMRSVDLTHGGFYGHFASRADLLAQALARALDDGHARSRVVSRGAVPLAYAEILRRYLSRSHRDARGEGCAIAALAADVARADPAARAVMGEHLERFAQQLGQAIGSDDEGDAWFALSALIGALLVSRVLTDPARSAEVLAVARTHLLALAAPPHVANPGADPSASARTNADANADPARQP